MDEKTLEKVRRWKAELAKSYGVCVSSIVYIGNNHFIVVKDGKMIRI